MSEPSLFQQQAAFMQASGQKVEKFPVSKWNIHCELYWRLCMEEFMDETHAAVNRYKQSPSLENLTDIADGIVDSIYVLLGLANSMGLPFDELWAEVQRSNMAKVDPVSGTVLRREDGKTLKPKGWTPPDLWSIIHESLSKYSDEKKFTQPGV